eukprot:gene9791-biopygen22755
MDFERRRIEPGKNEGTRGVGAQRRSKDICNSTDRGEEGHRPKAGGPSAGSLVPGQRKKSRRWVTTISKGHHTNDRQNREASKEFWAKLDTEIQEAKAQQQSVILIGDFNATPTDEGRDGRPTKGDEALQRIMTRHNLQDMGPQQRTYHHIRKEDGHLLSSSRIDLVLGTPEAHQMVNTDTAEASEMPWTTSHQAVQVQVESMAKFPLTDRKLKFKHPLPKAQTEAATQYAEELEERAKLWPQLEAEGQLPKEQAALEMWADMWMHTAHMAGLQVRAGTGGS